MTTSTATKPRKPVDTAPRTSLKTIPTDRIDRDENQPREVFDEDALRELAGSLKEIGQQQAISVRYLPNTRRYVLISGERRWRAAQMAGLTEMHAMVVHGLGGGGETLETFERSVTENLSRVDMTPLEEARAFQKLLDFGLGPQDVAERVGRSRNHVDCRLQLLKLTPALQEALVKGHLPMGPAWYVAQLSAANQNAFIGRWTRGEFGSPREAEMFCQKVRAEEEQASRQDVMFVLADAERDDGAVGESVFPNPDEVDVERREQIITDRARLVSRIGKLGGAGEILAEIADMDPNELALLLATANGGISGNRAGIDHLSQVAARAAQNLAKAATAAAVRAGALRIAPGAEA